MIRPSAPRKALENTMPTVDQCATKAARTYSGATIGSLLCELRDGRSGGAITPSHLSLVRQVTDEAGRER